MLGIEEGINQGMQLKEIETVKNMLKENLDVDLIAKITKLSKEEIMKIKESK